MSIKVAVYDVVTICLKESRTHLGKFEVVFEAGGGGGGRADISPTVSDIVEGFFIFKETK